MTRELEVDGAGCVPRLSPAVLSSASRSPEPTDSPLVCADDAFFDECVDLEHDGEDLVLAWQELEPEEDPGIVYVIDRRDDEDVLAQYSGVSITATRASSTSGSRSTRWPRSSPTSA